MQEHFKKLENMYHAAPFQELIKSKLKISEGEAELEMEIDPILHHAADAIHGFVYFKMMDDVAIFATNSIEKEFFLLTSSFNLLQIYVQAGTKTIVEIDESKINLEKNVRKIEGGVLRETGYLE